MHGLALLFALAFLAFSPLAQAATPDIVTRDTQANMRECRSAGGRPSLRPEYETTADLNDDGRPDTIIDLSGLNCDGAASFFCGSAGCPLTVYLSSSSAYRAKPLGHVQGWELDPSTNPPALVLSLHGSACGRVGAEGCMRRLAWNGRDLVATARGGGGRSATPPDQPASPTPGGWSLRPVSGRSPAAVVTGPGQIANLALLCQQGRAIAAVTFRQPPPASSATLRFSDGRQRVDVFFTEMRGGGSAWYADLAASSLPTLLLQRDTPLSLAIDNTLQGQLPRQGAGQALRQALSPCLRLR